MLGSLLYYYISTLSGTDRAPTSDCYTHTHMMCSVPPRVAEICGTSILLLLPPSQKSLQDYGRFICNMGTRRSLPTPSFPSPNTHIKKGKQGVGKILKVFIFNGRQKASFHLVIEVEIWLIARSDKQTQKIRSTGKRLLLLLVSFKKWK